jgi:hypothetical protein
LNLVEATLNLFEAAINDGCDYVFLLSGSCVPIHSFNYIYRELEKRPQSRIHYCPEKVEHGYFGISETKRRYESAEEIKKYVDLNNFIKSEQWVGLKKEDALIVCKKRGTALKYFNGVFAADEHYIPTVLNKEGVLSSCINSPITYTNWSDNVDWRHPVKYLRFNDKILNVAMETGAFFMRKASVFGNSYSANLKYAKKIISLPKKEKYIIYVHIPKNGGCSVKKLFNGYGRFFNFSHKTAKEIYKEVGGDVWEESFKISLVRNPWDRVLSAYYFFAVGGLSKFNDEEKAREVGISIDKAFSKWIIENESNFMNPKFPFAGTPVWQHFKKQIQYINRPIDCIVKLEELGKKESSPFKVNLPKENSSEHLTYHELYTTDAKAIIAKAYEEDIEAFRYVF